MNNKLELLNNGNINEQLALNLHAKADMKAHKLAQKNGQKAYGADEIDEQLRVLLRPYLMKENLLNKDEYSRIQEIINDWECDPNNMSKCAPVQQALLGLLVDCKQQQQQQQLKEIVGEYLEHLTNKKIQHPDNQKLSNRFNAISELDKLINKETLNDDLIAQAEKAIDTCLNNKPDWSERGFLQKFTDILTMGFKPLYRAYFSKERKYEEKLSQALEKPKLDH